MGLDRRSTVILIVGALSPNMVGCSVLGLDGASRVIGDPLPHQK